MVAGLASFLSINHLVHDAGMAAKCAANFRPVRAFRFSDHPGRAPSMPSNTGKRADTMRLAAFLAGALLVLFAGHAFAAAKPGAADAANSLKEPIFVAEIV